MMTLFGLVMALISPTRKFFLKSNFRLTVTYQESCEAALEGLDHCYGCPITDGAVIDAWEDVVNPVTLGVIILGLGGNFLSVWVLARTASSRWVGRERGSLASQMFSREGSVTC